MTQSATEWLLSKPVEDFCRKARMTSAELEEEITSLLDHAATLDDEAEAQRLLVRIFNHLWPMTGGKVEAKITFNRWNDNA